MLSNIFRFFNLLCFFMLLSLASSAQGSQNKNIQLNFNDSDTLSFSGNLVETEEDDDEIDEEAGADQSMLFIYFNRMPGYGLYSNFDILKLHYVHDRTILPDTIVLGNYVHPAPYKATSFYGVKRRRGRIHHGVDIPFPEGTPVVAAFDGIVRVSTYNNGGGYGNLVIIRHDNKLETYYAHLYRRLVNPGQMVHAGDTIGLGGNTGRSKGSHLHLETRYLGVHFNPAMIIDFHNYKLSCETLYVGGKSMKTNSSPTPNTPTLSSQTSDTSPFYITVRKGDTLGYLAKKYRTTVDRIKKLNNMKSDFLREGQKLRIK